MGNKLIVSAIVPCRNEEKYIAKCLDSIVGQDFPKENLEVFVVDGASEDKSREIIKRYANNYHFIRLIDNPKLITPSGMNIGIKNSKGDIIIKMDAHSVYKKDYISKCVERLRESKADNVGGVLKTIPSNDTLTVKAIAIVLSHFFGAGGSYFRTGVKHPIEVDTVAFGCYWRKTIEEIGLYDERMAKIEDLELNYRLRKRGGKIILFPDIQAFYYPSSEGFKDFFIHNFGDGFWSTYSLRYGFRTSLRHYIPLIFVLTLPISILPYLLLSLLFSLQIAFMEKDLRLFFVMPFAFAARHFGYGLGSAWGLIKLFINGTAQEERN